MLPSDDTKNALKGTFSRLLRLAVGLAAIVGAVLLYSHFANRPAADASDATGTCLDEFCVTAWEGKSDCFEGYACRFHFTGTKPAEVEGPIVEGSAPFYLDEGEYEISGDEVGSTEWEIEGRYRCGVASGDEFQMMIGPAGEPLGENWEPGKDDIMLVPWLVTCESAY